MERYSHLQTMPNSPLTPLTPLSENTKFEFNFGGDGSLDAYIDSVRHEHRVEKQQKKLLSQANKPYHQEACPLHPRRDVFEVHDGQKKPAYYQQQQQQSNPKALHINYKQITPTPNKPKIVVHDHEATPTNIRTPLKPRNHNIPQNVNSKTPLTKLHLSPQTIPQQQQQQQQQPRVFKQASPVARRPLCPHVAKLLAQRGLNMYASVFQREEIDMFALQLLKLQDLHQMGITNQQHIDALVNHVRNVVKYL
ncbi:hypothetical protein DOY81_001163 [Sarcophaga bullata]|nr:hypothetical protein DOY81_001163 [Sarcophaga bullata]